jgi:hypothetical protein
MASPFAGSWHYRSFKNDPTTPPPGGAPGADWPKLYFAEGDFTFSDAPVGHFEGSADFGGGYTMAFHGNSGLGSPMQVRFQGVGTGAQNKAWDYDYIGYYIPVWPNSTGQVDAIVGSIVRSKPHDGEPAGVTASFILLRNPVAHH